RRCERQQKTEAHRAHCHESTPEGRHETRDLDRETPLHHPEATPVQTAHRAAAKAKASRDLPLTQTLLVAKEIEITEALGQERRAGVQEMKKTRVRVTPRRDVLLLVQSFLAKSKPPLDQVDGLMVRGMENPGHVDRHPWPGFPQRKADLLEKIRPVLRRYPVLERDSRGDAR